MQYSNSQILSAVLNKWLQPVVLQLSQAKMSSIPFIQALENKAKSTGWVSPNWSLASELSPLVEPITNSIMQPMLTKYLSTVPDEAIPSMVHSLVDKALADGKLEIMEGRLVFDKDDLNELKNLLNYNLPLANTSEYIVKTSIDNKAEAQAAVSLEQTK